jgi:hypothetical protein
MYALFKRACPHCRSLEASRSRRHGGIERYVLRGIGVLPYRWLDRDTAFMRSRGSALELRSLTKLRELAVAILSVI